MEKRVAVAHARTAVSTAEPASSTRGGTAPTAVVGVFWSMWKLERVSVASRAGTTGGVPLLSPGEPRRGAGGAADPARGPRL
ncbi:hypothetical protein [Streptosporangium sp. NBC_01469]|uniref:hypothetical protein n=1 Tax=Streptosporangium sp. NBC_01469 TaxID=2903898 RepID=UPI002E2BF53A|nr:hypothetical protein [Streptosporangium sp. NBC_01469]